MQRKITGVLALAVLCGFQTASAVTIYGLSTRSQLVTFDSASPTDLSSAYFISGMANNEAMIGIDIRPSSGALYGLGSLGNIYTINGSTGVATMVSSLGTRLNGVEFGIDFNPVVDRLRIVSDLGQNLRVNVDTGATTVDTNINQSGRTPHVMAAGYTNNFSGSTSTTLYDIDSTNDRLLIQNPPNNGTLNDVGALGVDVTALGDLDIMFDGSTDVAFAALQQKGIGWSTLYSINLGSGAASAIGTIGTEESNDSLAIRDLAVVPEPASLLALGAGVAALAARRRNRR